MSTVSSLLDCFVQHRGRKFIHQLSCDGGRNLLGGDLQLLSSKLQMTYSSERID